MNAVQILDQLVSFPSVVGTANGEIVDWIVSYLESHSVKATVLPGPEGDRANLFASIGPVDQAGYIVSGHMDVVPADEAGWRTDPFRLHEEDGRLYGRGSTDMKGFLAAVLASVPVLKSCRLERPIHIAFSYDEEAGCRGVPHLIARLPDLCAKPAGAIIGEPSGMRAVRAHKGKAGVRIAVKGCAGHSSRPDLGVNAIHLMAQILAKVAEVANSLTKGPFAPAFEPPYSSLQVGTVHGGQALNIIPDLCVAEIEGRAISGVAPVTLLQPVREMVDALSVDGVEIEWTALGSYPALSLDKDAPLATLLEDLTGTPTLAAVSYGTEAGLFKDADIDSIICGPGDINRAHKPNEFILRDELATCQAMVEALGRSCVSSRASGPPSGDR